MRISNNMLMREMLYNLNLNQNNMAKYHKQLSSGGKRIFRPSDDPVGVSRVLKYTSDVNMLQQFKSTVTSADGYNNVSHNAVMNIKEILHTLREHAIAASNEPKTPEDIKKYAIEIEQLKKELVILGNSTNGGNYIFSGLETDKKLFNEDGSFHLLMTTERVEEKPVIQYEVTVGEIMKVGVHPTQLFGIVPEHNLMTDFMPRATVKATPAERSEINMKVDATKAYDGSTIKVNVDGVDFTVKTSELTSDHTNPMDKKRFVRAFANAENALGHKLSDHADIFFDDNDRFVIRNKKAGAAHTISINENAADIQDVRNVNGVDSVNGVYDAGAHGGLKVMDSLVAREQKERSIVVTHTDEDGKTKTAHIKLDFSAYPDAAALQTALQSSLDAHFGTGVVRADVAHAAHLKFEVTQGELKVDSVIATKSQMLHDVDRFIEALHTGDYDKVRQNIDIMGKQLDQALSVLGDIGGRTNRLHYIKGRIEENTVTFTGLMDKIKNEDYGTLITLFKNMENVYRASLSVGSRVIQPSLVDFIK
ncbi:MAG: flagellar hook-associated protein FlgL [Bacillota bacterium]|nr:flagellar hook-associated protein FlgL [Bacillota bacterium]